MRFHSNALLHTNPDVLFLFVSHISIHLCLSSGSFGSVWKCMFLLPLICTDLQPRTIHTAGIFSLTDNIFGWDTQVIKKENGDVFIRHTSCWLATVLYKLRSWGPDFRWRHAPNWTHFRSRPRPLGSTYPVSYLLCLGYDQISECTKFRNLCRLKRYLAPLTLSKKNELSLKDNSIITFYF